MVELNTKIYEQDLGLPIASLYNNIYIFIWSIQIIVLKRMLHTCIPGIVALHVYADMLKITTHSSLERLWRPFPR